MRRFYLILALLLLSVPAPAQTTTSLGLTKPTIGSTDWGVAVNQNFQLIDDFLSGKRALPAIKVTGKVTLGSCEGCGSGGPGSVSWGQVGGTLSNQSDLNTALGLKLNSSSFTRAGVVGLWTSCTGYLKSDGTCDPATTTNNPAGSGTELQYRNGANFGAVSGSSVSGSDVTFGGGLYAASLSAPNHYVNDAAGKLQFFNGSGYDLFLGRDAAGILAQKDGGNPQTLRVYGTTTGNKYAYVSYDAPNNRAVFSASGDTAISSDAGSVITLLNVGGGGLTTPWRFSQDTGALDSPVDNSYDIGRNGANRPRTGYFGTSVVAPTFTGDLTGNVTGNVSGTAGSLASQYIDWSLSSGGASIKNKPTLAQTKAAVTGQPLLSYDSATGAFTQGALTAAQVGALSSSTVLAVTKTAVAGQPLLSYDAGTGAFTQGALTAAQVGALPSTTVLAATKAAASGQPLLSYDAATGTFTQGSLTAAQVGALASSTVLPATKTAVAGQALTSYDSGTGAFGQGALTAANVGAVPTVGQLRSVTYIAGSETAASPLADTDDQPEFWQNNLGQTYRITAVSCKVDNDNSAAAKPTINLLNGANLAVSACACAQAAWTSCSVNATYQDIAANAALGYQTQVAGGTAKRVTVAIQLTGQ